MNQGRLAHARSSNPNFKKFVEQMEKQSWSTMVLGFENLKEKFESYPMFRSKAMAF
jgi:hypothetical protein